MDAYGTKIMFDPALLTKIYRNRDMNETPYAFGLGLMNQNHESDWFDENLQEEKRRLIARKSGFYTASDVLDCVPDEQWLSFTVEDWFLRTHVDKPRPQRNLTDKGQLNVQRVLDAEILRICVESGVLKDDNDLAFCMGLVGRHNKLLSSFYQRKLKETVKAVAGCISEWNTPPDSKENRESQSQNYQRFLGGDTDLNNNVDCDDDSEIENSAIMKTGDSEDVPLPIGHERKVQRESDQKECFAKEEVESCQQVKPSEVPKRKSRKQRRRAS